MTRKLWNWFVADEWRSLLTLRQSLVYGFTPVLLCICFSARYVKNDAARIPNFDMEMFHDEIWKPIHFGVKKSKVKVKSHKNFAGVGLCFLVSAGFF